MKKIGSILLLCIVLVGVFTVLTQLEIGSYDKSKEALEETEDKETTAKENEYTVVVDAGHGGIDPGKVGVNGVYEMDINLTIAYELQMLLEGEGIKVIMTRNDNNGLYKETDTNKKMSDLRKRVEIVNDSGADALVSIHQNSFTDESVRGPQVFYYKTSQSGKVMAENVTKKLHEMDGEHKREKKTDTEYYVLKKSVIPAVLVECGFLSNSEEAALLSDNKYQEKIAKAICDGIIAYLNEQEEGTNGDNII